MAKEPLEFRIASRINNTSWGYDAVRCLEQTTQYLDTKICGEDKRLGDDEFYLLTPADQDGYEACLEKSENAFIKTAGVYTGLAAVVFAGGISLANYLGIKDIGEQIANCEQEGVYECTITPGLGMKVGVASMVASFGLSLVGVGKGLRRRRQLSNDAAEQYRGLLDKDGSL